MIKGNNIFWDLDGVLRNLSCVNGEIPTSWDQVYSNGMNLIENIDTNLYLLEEAPVTEYIEVALECDPIHIVSAQFDAWRPYTNRWLDKHIPNARVKYMSNPHDKLKYLSYHRRVLIEDFPNFTSYERVIVIDRPYNKEIALPHIRVHNPNILMQILKEKVQYELEGNEEGWFGSLQNRWCRAA